MVLPIVFFLVPALVVSFSYGRQVEEIRSVDGGQQGIAGPDASVVSQGYRQQR